MGLTKNSVGRGALNSTPDLMHISNAKRVIALAGNPNVGKSTVFNALTGMHQHTGNWPGKTVSNASGLSRYNGQEYALVDLPGTYSLMANSAEEEIARNFICFGSPTITIVVCDATCLERNLNLVLQTIELSSRTIVCVNLLDEAKRKHIKVDLFALSRMLGVKVIGCTARKKKTLYPLMDCVEKLCEDRPSFSPSPIIYPAPIERALALLLPSLPVEKCCGIPPRWLALRLLEGDQTLIDEIEKQLGISLIKNENIRIAYDRAKELLREERFTADTYRDSIVSAVVAKAEEIARACTYVSQQAHARDRCIDRILTGKISAFPVMLFLLVLVFWLTIAGANYPSSLLSRGLFYLQDRLSDLFSLCHAPAWLHGLLVEGMYRVLAWVVSVMLPPMAIFFPLFTLLEDAGYLPRIAYNLDRPFQRCNACGKQALTMCMGFGCNAAGIIGCRIIDSPRERLLAILTNSFVPCNGRFPTMLTLLTIFFVGTVGGLLASLYSALLLTLLIVIGIALTFLVTRLLSATLLRGIPSSFTLELPPYRRPQIGQVLVRSICDRTLFVLGRAIVVAAPAGLIIWGMANVAIDGVSILNHCANFLDPFARLMGLDGILLMAFILSLPANEITLPIALMAYLSQGTLTEIENLSEIRTILLSNGWTPLTAVCMLLFSLLHWPCSTTILTIKREAGGWRWAILAFLLPTIFGILLCMAVNGFAHLLF